MALKDLIKSVNRQRNIASAQTQIPADIMFLADFNTALIKLEVERAQAPPPDGYFRPSSLYGCERMLYYMKTGKKADKELPEAGLIGIQESGTDRHARIQAVLARMAEFGFDCQCLDIDQVVAEAQARGINSEFVGWNDDHTEARCKNDDYCIYFQPDGVFVYRGIRYVFEIKTENSFNFGRRTAPKDDHLMQGTCYAMGLGVDKIMYFYENRDFTQKKPYIVDVTDELKNKVIDKIERVNTAAKRRKVPAKQEEKCKYCRYKEQCKKDAAKNK